MRRAKHFILWGSTFFVLTLLSVSGSSLGTNAMADETPDGYTFYGGCGLMEDTLPSHLCHKGDSLGAFFKSDGRTVLYDVCVRFPIANQKTTCATNQEAQDGTLYVNKITSNIVGRTTITWSVDSQLVGTWVFGLYPKPIVPRFGVNPLIGAGTHRVYGLLLKHVGSHARVRVWRRCGGFCPLHLRWIGNHGSIRRYAVASQRGVRFSLGETLYIQVDEPGGREHGAWVWGRLYTGQFVRSRKGGVRDTAIRRVGQIRCTPPRTTFRHAISCRRVP